MNVGGDLEEEGLDHEDLESGSIFHGVYIPNPIEFDTPQANEPTQQKPHRLVIDTIEVVNFKSYAKKRIIGPFHQVSNLRSLTYLMKPRVHLNCLFPQFLKGDKVAIFKDSEDYSRCFC